MPAHSSARFVVLVAAAALLAGCGSGSGSGAASGSSSASGSTTPTLQLRLVTSSTDGPCSEPPLTSDTPGSACGESGTTTYQVGASLGEMTPTGVTCPGGQAERRVFSVKLDEAGSAKLDDVTREAVGKQLAVLVEGRVFSAPRVMDSITNGQMELVTTTPAEARQAAAALHASATP